MATRKQKRGGGGAFQKPRAGYDVQMVRDFLEHLLWELRTAEYENTRDDPKIINPELAANLARCIQKRGTAALWIAHRITHEGTTEEERRRWGPEVSAVLAKNLGKAVHHLESLQDVFGLALWCAERPRGFILEIPLRQFIDDEGPRGGRSLSTLWRGSNEWPGPPEPP